MLANDSQYWVGSGWVQIFSLVVGTVGLGRVTQNGPMDNSGLYRYLSVLVLVRAATYWFRTGNTWLTVLLTLNRYMRVCQPLEFSRHCTVRRTCVVSTHERPRILVRGGGVNAPLLPEAKNISKISLRHGAFWSILF